MSKNVKKAKIFNEIDTLQPDLNGALFYWWLNFSKPAIKKAGMEGGKSCPNYFQ